MSSIIIFLLVALLWMLTAFVTGLLIGHYNIDKKLNLWLKVKLRPWVNTIDKWEQDNVQ